MEIEGIDIIRSSMEEVEILKRRLRRKSLEEWQYHFFACAHMRVCATELLSGIKLGKNPFANLQVIADKKSEQLNSLLRSDGRLEFES